VIASEETSARQPEARQPEARQREEVRWADWMRSAQAGDGDAYRKLLGELEPVIGAYLSRMLGDPTLVEDCSQDALLALHRARDTWDPRRAFRPWLFTIVRHKALDTLRSRKRWTQRIASEEDAEDTAPDAHRADATQTPDVAMDAVRCLGGLDEKYREALVLTKLRGHTVTEAADVAGVSSTAMKTRVHRALRLVRKQFEKEPW
jgi:RNA polymerase sigma-70 factor (ECF subfamily)